MYKKGLWQSLGNLKQPLGSNIVKGNNITEVFQEEQKELQKNDKLKFKLSSPDILENLAKIKINTNENYKNFNKQYTFKEGHLLKSRDYLSYMIQNYKQYPGYEKYENVSFMGYLNLNNKLDSIYSNIEPVGQLTSRFHVFSFSVPGHANLIFIDNKNKTIERFEPSSSKNLHIKYTKIDPNFDGKRIRNEEIMTEATSVFVDKLLNQFFQKNPFYSGYTYFPEFSCPYIGPQKKDYLDTGFCQTWTILYAERRILNPDVSRDDILSDLLSNSPQKLHDIIKEFAQKVNDIIPADVLYELQEFFNIFDFVKKFFYEVDIILYCEDFGKYLSRLISLYENYDKKNGLRNEKYIEVRSLSGKIFATRFENTYLIQELLDFFRFFNYENRFIQLLQDISKITDKTEKQNKIDELQHICRESFISYAKETIKTVQDAETYYYLLFNDLQSVFNFLYNLKDIH